MQYFKTFEGMITAAFEEKGMKDDNGKPIRATEIPISLEEFTANGKNPLLAAVVDMLKSPLP